MTLKCNFGKGQTYVLGLLFLNSFIANVSCSSAEVESHLQLGVQLLSRGNLHDALTHFHAAIDGDPKNYLSYYRRATVYLALGRSRSSLNDLDEVLQLKPDFTAARTTRASVLVKLGRLDEAYIDLEVVLAKDSNNAEALNLFNSIVPLQQKLQSAQSYFNSKHYSDAVPVLSQISEECPWDPQVREMKFEALQAMGEIRSAISEMRAITKLTQDNTNAFYKLAKILYQVGDVDQSLSEIRECLKLDPDHQTCFTFYKKVKKVAKLLNDAEEYKKNNDNAKCVSSSLKILKEDSTVDEVKFLAYDKLCQCESDPANSVEYCNQALSIREEARIYCDRADAHLSDGKFDEAISDFSAALKLDEHLQRAREGLDRVKKLKKQAGKRDYYKILGVKRTATKREITKAYRQMAQKWHPDHFDGDSKKEAEKKFIDIAAAKEVLTDDEKRAQFDAGTDPLDPEQQQGGFHGGGGRFNPFDHFSFGQGGFQSGGGPFHFKFHFN